MKERQQLKDLESRLRIIKVLRDLCGWLRINSNMRANNLKIEENDLDNIHLPQGSIMLARQRPYIRFRKYTYHLRDTWCM